jgi:asparagine synthase (glutamine-hydrolysing)
LALKLLDASPYPIEGLPIWKEVAAVSEGDYLEFNGDGNAINIRTWWKPPESTLSIAEAAPLIRQAVERSIDVLAANNNTVSCDLSGGLDSTPLFLVAAERVANITAFTVGNEDPADDDLFWVQ